jgi:FlaA1/EpsC-like NDP-sugar epimerase
MLFTEAARFFGGLVQRCLPRRAPERDNVIVYGAGESGASLVQALEGQGRFHPVAFVDDDPALQGNRVNGLRVHARQSLPALVKKHRVSSVLLALPSAPRWRRREIIASLEGLAVHVQTVPDFNALISGQARVQDIRDVDVEDLRSRPPVAPEAALMRATLHGKSVMVTGAGGSIGSELCREILRVGPRKLLLFELSEAALSQVEKEMRALATSLGIHCEIVPLPGSVQDGRRVEAAMQRYAVNTVYHAAACNHVPLEEDNLIEGVSNNVFGTRRTALAAMQAGVETFVLVSTDEAVSPASVTGASKRMAELVLQALQESAAVTRFAAVRFGNVLESPGSVVPLFREQIRSGGPVTVTHPEVTREFMTVPEAARLVLQAGGMARGGEVVVLDRGEPVKISQLAKRMISLMGLTLRDDDHPDGDIEIRYTGLRPAGKLREEFPIGDNVSGTAHPRILRAREKYLHSIELNPMLEALQRAATDLDYGGVRDVLRYAVKAYRPTNGIDDLLYREREVRAEDESELFSLRTGKPLPSRVEPPSV